MKITSLIWAFLLFVSISSFSQSPNSFKYQSILRDKNGLLMADKTVTLRISILQTKIDGTIVYAETHSTKTSATGIINLEIGKGTIVSGSFSSILWGTNSHFVKIEMDPVGGSAFELVGTSQLLSVPYALFAQTSGDEKWDTATGGINYKGGNVGIANLNPLYKLDVAGSINATSFLLGGKAIVSSPWASTGSNLSFTTGNVGIGTSAPNSNLDIQGINATLGIYKTKFTATESVGKGRFELRNDPNDAGIVYSTSLDRIGDTSEDLLFGIQHPVGNTTSWGIMESWRGAGLMISSSGPELNPLVFGVDRVEKARLIANGNLGLGTTNPIFKLDVNGSVNSSQYFLKGVAIDFSKIGPWDSSNNNALFNGSGNVGIGTASPFYKLDINGALNATSILLGGKAIVSSPWASTGSDLSFTTGNVGIGTSAPNSNLDIQGINATLGLYKTKFTATESVGKGRFELRNDPNDAGIVYSTSLDRIGDTSEDLLFGIQHPVGNTTSWGIMESWRGAGLMISSSGPELNPLVFGVDRVEKARLIANGNLGLGTTNPRTKLQVENGDVYINSITSGVIMKSPNGGCWRMTVSNTGTPIFTAITCP